MTKEGWYLIFLFFTLDNIPRAITLATFTGNYSFLAFFVMGLEIAFWYLFIWYLFRMVKKEHFKQSSNPEHWSHQAYHRIFKEDNK